MYSPHHIPGRFAVLTGHKVRVLYQLCLIGETLYSLHQLWNVVGNVLDHDGDLEYHRAHSPVNHMGYC